MNDQIFVRTKLIGKYAKILDEESKKRRMTKPTLAAEYIMRGIDASHSPSASDLESFERRISATFLNLRSDIEALIAEVDTLFAFIDTFAKQMLLHLPEPLKDEAEGIAASTMKRYEKLIESVAKNGFDKDRPRAVKAIAEILSKEETENE